MANLLRLPSCILLLSFGVGAAAALSENNLSNSSPRLSGQYQALLVTFHQVYPAIFLGKVTVWEMVALAALCSLGPGIWWLRKRQRESKYSLSNSVESLHNAGGKSQVADDEHDATDAQSTDPGLLRKHSQYKSYTTSRFTYPNLRVFFRRHPQEDKLPTKPAPLPLLVFIHGLGGSVAQFHPLLTSLVNLASCLSVDLPGCGLSSFEPKSWDAYTMEALAELLGQIIEDYREKDAGQGVVLLGHSMGCSLAALLASKTSIASSTFSDHVVGLVAVCPMAGPPSEEQVALFRKLLWVPNTAFNLWRKWDQRGGTNSQSVLRFVGKDSDENTRELQRRFNAQSKSAVWRRMASGTLPTYHHGIPKGGLPGGEVWSGLDVPIFLIAGESDNITKPTEIEKIAAFLGKSHPVQIEIDENSDPIIDTTTSKASKALVASPPKKQEPTESQINALRAEDFSETNPNPNTAEDVQEDPITPSESGSIIPPQPSKPKKVLKSTILPAPASHALLYQPAQVRILAGLISDFLCSQVSPRLSLGWQLQFLSTAGKWDVKNLAKWQAVTPVSEPIADVFRAMKTLREVDETHCPEVFVRNWGSQIKDIIDISHDQPVYDPRGLEKGGIHYHKFPTVSKIPPTNEEVAAFVTLVDRLREEQKIRAEKEGWGKVYIGVHCHYGFNRTGYFMVCYLVERMGWDVQMAIDEFARQRPKGIKHAHFLDQLFVRFCKGLKRAPTL